MGGSARAPFQAAAPPAAAMFGLVGGLSPQWRKGRWVARADGPYGARSKASVRADATAIYRPWTVASRSAHSPRPAKNNIGGFIRGWSVCCWGRPWLGAPLWVDVMAFLKGRVGLRCDAAFGASWLLHSLVSSRLYNFGSNCVHQNRQPRASKPRLWLFPLSFPLSPFCVSVSPVRQTCFVSQRFTHSGRGRCPDQASPVEWHEQRWSS